MAPRHGKRGRLLPHSRGHGILEKASTPSGLLDQRKLVPLGGGRSEHRPGISRGRQSLVQNSRTSNQRLSSGNFGPPTEDCSPDEAYEFTSPGLVYRLVCNNPSTGDDFRSQRAERPDRIFRDVTECQASGLPVFASRNVAEGLSTGGRLQGLSVCQVTLAPGAGRIQPTGRRSHHTWWPLADYEILANCQVVAP